MGSNPTPGTKLFGGRVSKAKVAGSDPAAGAGD